MRLLSGWLIAVHGIEGWTNAQTKERTDRWAVDGIVGVEGTNWEVRGG